MSETWSQTWLDLSRHVEIDLASSDFLYSRLVADLLKNCLKLAQNLVGNLAENLVICRLNRIEVIEFGHKRWLAARETQFLLIGRLSARLTVQLKTRNRDQIYSLSTVAHELNELLPFLSAPFNGIVGI